MQIFIHTLPQKIIPLDVQPGDTILVVKEKIHDTGGAPPSEQRLIMKGKELDDKRTLADYSVTQESDLFLCLKLMGD